MFAVLAPRSAALTGLVVGLLALVPAAQDRAWQGSIGSGPLQWHWRLDVVAAVLLVFVSALGWVVARFCAVNLRGRAGAGAGGLLALVLVALDVMVSSRDLVALAAGWTVSGVAVAALIARTGTERAPEAAQYLRRHLLVGDAALWAAVGLLAWWFGASDRAALGALAAGWQADVVAGLLAVACVTRSGLVPAHRWLQETAEAPSPVSGLLHAGIVNGAGVLGVLTWPSLVTSPVVLIGLLLVGLATVAVGVWAGAVRRDVKGRLAWSTTSQMGFMTVQLGLGLPAMALMHVVAHGSYKSWLFLRAGGAVDRHRHRWQTRRRPARQTALAALALAVTAAAALPAAAALVSTSGVPALVPVLLGVVTATAAGWHAGGLLRVPTPLAVTVAALGGVVGAAYLWLLRGWEVLMDPVLTATPVWAGTGGVAVVTAVLLSGAVVLAGCRELQRRPRGRLMVALLPLSVAPGRVPGRQVSAAGAAGRPRDASGPGVEREEALRIVDTVARAASSTGPAWPLRAMVAANPLAPLEHLPFAEAVARAEDVHGTRLRPPLEYYLACYAGGRVDDEYLRTALDAARPGDPVDVAGFVAGTRRLQATGADDPAGALPGHRLVERIADRPWARRAVDHEVVWLLQAWASVSPSAAAGAPGGPYGMWRAAARGRGYDRATRIRGAAEWVAQLPTDPLEAIDSLARQLRLGSEGLESYLTDLFAAGPGWTGHAAWRAREEGTTGPLVELAALRMAHDVLFTSATVDPAGAAAALPDPSRRRPGPVPAEESEVAAVWQHALELAEQSRLLDRLVAPTPAVPGRRRRPASQSLWCIDVRSERLRRHLEAAGDHETYGFAGFFGAAVRHTDADGNTTDRCPAIVRPSLAVTATAGPLRLRQAVHRAATSVSRHPLAALAVADGGGMLSGLTSLATLLRPDLVRRLLRSASTDEPPASRADHVVPPSSGLSVEERVELAHGALTATGLVDGFAPVVLVCGHGATIENNAFVSAYDCGACGGHAGAVNATLLADALNDPQVRARLGDRGVHLPDDTVAVAAVHDTTTDEVRPLTPGAPAEVLRDLRRAGEGAARERLDDLPGLGRRTDPHRLRRRAADWSEPTPEWGLAGNAALVIGPRSLTRHVPLDGRVFLHSYDERVDRSGDILTLLLTAPLVVAQWINAQYYFSAVAPDLFGSGDKTTHNVVGDVGVLSGVRGDLRTGLPWQALSRAPLGRAGGPGGLVHTPVRLTVVVAADPGRIRAVVEQHSGLRDLVTGRWIILLALDADGLVELGCDLGWRPFSTTLSTPPGAMPVTTREYA